MEKRLTVKNAVKPGYFLEYQKGKDTVERLEKVIDKCGFLEDIEESLQEIDFYGKVFQYPGKIMKLRFLGIVKGHDFAADLRAEFELANGLGNVQYSIWSYGKQFSRYKEDLK